jgi:hypothetical protein
LQQYHWNFLLEQVGYNMMGWMGKEGSREGQGETEGGWAANKRQEGGGRACNDLSNINLLLNLLYSYAL